MKKIVALGGGTGLFTLLSGLKKYPLDISVVVNMTDDGGNTGLLRDEFGVLPPGDIRRCIAALSESPAIMRQLFTYRFNKGGLKGHNFGNLFITALKEITGSDQKAIKETAKILKIKGQVIPVTLANRCLCAELENGQIIKGESNIDIPKYDGNLRIKKLFLNKPCQVNQEVVSAVKQADFIILGPGDLYGSIIANLIVDGIVAAIKSSKAKKIYICNLMTKYGETNDFTLVDFIKTMEKYLGKNVLDYVIYNKKIKVDKKVLDKYSKEKASLVKYNDRDLNKFKLKFIGADLLSKSNLLRHDSNKLAKVIWRLVNAKDAKKTKALNNTNTKRTKTQNG